MKINKEIRRLSREMLRASFTDAQLDPGRIASLVDSLVARKPRHYIEVLKNYRRLLRLELEKRQAKIETASKVDSATTSELVANLKRNTVASWQRSSSLIRSFLAECGFVWEPMYATERCANGSNVSNENFNQ